MKMTIEEAKRLMAKSGGGLDLRWTQITALPDNLTVGGWLDLSGTQISTRAQILTSRERSKSSRPCIASLPVLAAPEQMPLHPPSETRAKRTLSAR